MSAEASSSFSSPNGWWGIVIGLAGLGWKAYSDWADRKRKVLVRQVGTSVENVAMACGQYLPVIYLVRVSITNDSPRRPVTIAGYWLQLPWRDDYLDPMEDPAELVKGGDKYVLPGSGLWSYPREMILNHRTRSQGRLDVGENLCGGLLFRGIEPIPEDFSQGQEAEVRVTVVLEGGQRFSAECYLRIDKGFEARVLMPSGADLLVG